MIVVDASAVVELLLRPDASDGLTDRIFAPGEALHAPHLLDIEVMQVLRRYLLRSEMSGTRAGEAFDDFRSLRIHRHTHGPLLQRMWSLRANLTAYDASYVALAEALDCPLITRDHGLAEVAGRTVAVERL